MKQKRFYVVLIAIIATAVLMIVLSQNYKQKKSESIRIGAILPLTGSASEIAEQHKRGLDFAVDQINIIGGINRKKLEILYEDDKNDPKLTVSAFNKLVDTIKVPLVITVMSGPSMAIYPLADSKKVVLFANCGHPEITRLSNWVFRNFPTSRTEAQVMAGYIMDKLNVKSLSILYINDIFGEGAMQVLKESLHNSHIKIVSIDSFEKDASDFRSLVLKTINLEPEGVYVYGYGKANGLIVRQLREFGYKGYLLGSYNFSVDPTLNIAGVALEGSIFTMPPFDRKSDDQNISGFVKSFYDRYKKYPEWNTVIEYDAIYLISKILEERGVNSESIREGLSELSNFRGLMGEYKNLGNGEWQCELSIKTMKDGNIVSIEDKK